MSTPTLVHHVTEHIKTYLVAGTLVAVGIDVATNVTASMGGAMASMGGAMAQAQPMLAMGGLSVPGPLALLVQGVGVAILAIGLALYGANMWCGYAALRAFRFRFHERGPVLQACGWSAAFLYVLGSVAIGLSVNAVYLAITA